MKTQVIQINKNDDYISVCDKMSWSKTGRILLVWPGKGQILNQQLALVLIKRHADELGAQIAVVTHDSEVLFFAKQIGIPEFTNLRLALHSHWRKDKHKKAFHLQKQSRSKLSTMQKIVHSQSHEWMIHPAIRTICFVIPVLALFVLGIFILPGATISLSPQQNVQSITLSLIANPNLSAVNLASGGLPTYSQEVIVEGNESAPVTGSVIIPNQVARGKLRFTNISDHEVTVPPGTVVTTLDKDPVRYITTTPEDVKIVPGETAVISVRSIVPGTSGNVSPNTLVAIEGDLGLDVTVLNPYATHGGTDASVPAPTSQDIRLIHDRLAGKLAQAALTELRRLIPADDILVTPTLKLIEVIDETPTPALGEPGANLHLSMRLRYRSLVVAAQTMNDLVTPILEANTPPGYTAIENTQTIIEMTSPTLGEDGLAHWMVNIQRNLQVEIPIRQAIRITSGLPIAYAIEKLDASLSLAAEPKIDIRPAWWPWLPLLPMRILVIQAGTS